MFWNSSIRIGNIRNAYEILKDNWSGQPKYSNPVARRSGFNPEKKVMEAREQTDTFNVITNNEYKVDKFPPKNSAAINKYPVWQNTPRQNKNNTSGAIFANLVVIATKTNIPNKTMRSFKNHGIKPKK